MRIFLRSLVIAIVLIGLQAVLWPWLENLVYMVRLGAMRAPATLPVPVAGVKPARLVDTWGGARSGGRRHEGIDIFARRGTPVLSSTEGVVLRVGTNRLGGQVVWVLGPGGQRHYYAHLDRYGDVHAGMRVRRATCWAMSAPPATPRARRRTCTTASIRPAAPSILTLSCTKRQRRPRRIRPIPTSARLLHCGSSLEGMRTTIGHEDRVRHQDGHFGRTQAHRTAAQ